jgi:nitrogen fixation NifU-like protein
MPVSDARLAAAYQELILDHYRRPRNRGPMARPDARAELRNPLCGDEVALALALDAEGRVREARFTGAGCSISQASASMLTQLVAGKTVAEAAALGERFARMLGGDAAAAADPALGDLRALAGVARVPMRVKCALLSWRAFDEAVRSLARG